MQFISYIFQFKMIWRCITEKNAIVMKKRESERERNKLTDTENKPMVARVGRGWGEPKRGRGLRNANFQL